ncbi:MAG: hypothetical protein K1Y02_14175 [Candidatus Hydrogenedentes bacterium]|nr:hypothetical protein [Candidatus Hydrogenedentota bacterium]
MVRGSDIRGKARAVLIAVAFVSGVAAQTFPPMSVEISADHPLFLFAVPPSDTLDGAAYAQQVAGIWAALPEPMKPFSVLAISVDTPDATARDQAVRTALQSLQQAEIPVALQIADANPMGVYPIPLADELLATFPCVKGVLAADLDFNTYDRFGGGGDFGAPPAARWLTTAVEIAAHNGRFIAIRLAGPRWLRLMSNPACRPLYAQLMACRAFVVPLVDTDKGDTIAQQGALMGMWLEGAVDQWGVSASSNWYRNASFLEPGVFGRRKEPVEMPPKLYRAMLLNGAMGGATAYAFDVPGDLWFGERAKYWQESIQPALREMVQQGLIARREFVQKKAAVACQLAVAPTPEAFQINLRDVDGVRDQGLLMLGAYGMERPGQISELIPNTGRHYWVPILSAFAPADVSSMFGRIVPAGTTPSAQAWNQLLDQFHQPDGGGTAFVSRVGRGVFVMHTQENLYSEQTFEIPSLPAPVVGLEAERQNGTVVLKWPFREGDVSFKIYKRPYPGGEFDLIAEGTDRRTWTDPTPSADAAFAYAVTALTNEQAPYSGTVNYGDYLAFSVAESRIVEEAVISNIAAMAKGQPLETPADARPKSQVWWPNTEGLPEDKIPLAKEIAERLETLDKAFAAEDLDTVLDLYTTEYQDAQWWRFQYVKRAFQWFFERYGACRMDRQIREWDFSAFDSSGQVRVLVYCRFSGTAISDPSGRIGQTQAFFPCNDTGEVWFTLSMKEQVWRIERTEPSLPNMAEILSFSAGPYDKFVPGPDVYKK